MGGWDERFFDSTDENGRGKAVMRIERQYRGFSLCVIRNNLIEPNGERTDDTA